MPSVPLTRSVSDLFLASAFLPVVPVILRRSPATLCRGGDHADEQEEKKKKKKKQGSMVGGGDREEEEEEEDDDDDLVLVASTTRCAHLTKPTSLIGSVQSSSPG